MRFNRLVRRRSSLLLRTQQQEQFRSESTETTSENKEEKGPCGVQVSIEFMEYQKWKKINT
jgi:hypothetical protein